MDFSSKKPVITSIAMFLAVILIIVTNSKVFGQATEINNWNNQLNLLDFQYQSLKYQPGGITSAERNSIIANKKGILSQAGLGSFNSFGSYVDTQLSIFQSDGKIILSRRGESDELFSKYGMGRWFFENYQSVNSARDNLAILKEWGNSLDTIYVIKVPEGKLSLKGVASKQISGDGSEIRIGGSTQYWFLNPNKETNDWLLYAIYGPDHLKSYSTNITAAQQLGYAIVDDVRLHFEELRYNDLNYFKASSNQTNLNNQPRTRKSFNFWSRAYGFNVSSYNSNNKTSNLIHSSNAGIEKVINKEKSSLYVGGFSGYAGLNSKVNTNNKDLVEYDNIKNNVSSIHGGIYAFYQQKNKGYYNPQFFADAIVSSGYLHFTNNVPGILNKGFKQRYNGANLITSAEAGLTSVFKHGFSIEPVIGIDFNKIMHENFNDKIFAPVSLAKGSSLRGDIGLKIRKTIISKKNIKTLAYLKGCYSREFMGKNTINILDEQGIDNQRGNYFGVGGGLNINIFKRFSVKAEMLKLLEKEKGFRGNFAFLFNL
ncbi:MAG: autotransporter outer membrane beta-barrel domain-containing protein [Cyanobacteriota bacterium]